MEYSLAIGKYVHEVVEEATTDDLMLFIAVRNVEAKEQERARRRAAAQAKIKQGQ